MTAWTLPPSTLRWLAEVPRDLPVAMLIRHSVRGPLDEGDAGYSVPLTEDGHALALALGRHLGERLRSAHASPLVRTVQTAERLLEGAGARGTVVADTLLGDPGVYMLDRRAGPYWRSLGHEQMMTRLVDDTPPLPGCAASDAAARFLVRHMLHHAGAEAGIHAFATHDSLVTATAARLLRLPLRRPDWPWYLQAAFFWERDGKVHSGYADHRAERDGPLVSLTDADVIHFARREVAATVGLDCPARFFLAGGAFKSLLTGRPAHDLDLWAPSVKDRAALEVRLAERGAERLPEQPHSSAFRIAGRRVDLPHNTAPDTLEGRLARFDLGLSAVGAEHRPEDQWRAVIHPRATASVESRQVLLLDELLNWRHGLTTLERLRRYAAELGYEAPKSEEARLWLIFESQDAETRTGMVERFRANARGDQGVEPELTQRHPLFRGQA